jgi:hypothetical protein
MAARVFSKPQLDFPHEILKMGVAGLMYIPALLREPILEVLQCKLFGKNARYLVANLGLDNHG